jgi:hypothetical protein
MAWAPRTARVKTLNAQRSIFSGGDARSRLRTHKLRTKLAYPLSLAYNLHQSYPHLHSRTKRGRRANRLRWYVWQTELSGYCNDTRLGVK